MSLKPSLRVLLAVLALVLLAGPAHANDRAEGRRRSSTGSSYKPQKSAFRKNGTLKKTVRVKSSVDKHGKFRKSHLRRQ